MASRRILAGCVFTVVHIACIHALHLHGKWDSGNAFFMFLAKFGFQQTNPHDPMTNGYIYGNLTSASKIASGLSMVVVDSEYFMEYYGNRTRIPQTKACPAMFNKINNVAFDSRCQTAGPEDFLRKVPCPQNKLCVDEDNPKNVIPGYQFTFTVQDLRRPRFWYISFVSCHRNSTNTSACFWTPDPHQNVVVDYDIWLVNGHPLAKHINQFEHQFSFEQHDVFEMYVTFLVLYTILIPVWLYAYKQQRHPLTQIFTTCILLETTGILLNFIHTLKFALDGEGIFFIHIFGDAVDTFAECLFVLVLLVIAKGWAITSKDLTSRVAVFGVWTFYTVLNAGLFVWNLTEIDIISNIEEWETWPGYLILSFRMVIMIWFLFELRKTSRKERTMDRLEFFQHFGAGFLVWFVYLPLLAVITTQVSYLWKHKTVLSISYSADLLAFAVLVHLLWPSRTALNLVQRETALPPDELEVAGLLESEPTFREIVRSPVEKSKPIIPSGPTPEEPHPLVNGNVPHEQDCRNKPLKINKAKSNKKKNGFSLLNNEEYSEEDSL